MVSPTVADLRALLTKAAEIMANRSAEMWSPAFGPCKARTELEETSSYLYSDGHTPWGPAPLGFAWRAAELFYTTVLEHVRAAAILMQPPFRSSSAAVEARVAVEAAAQALWLTDSGLLSGRVRVGRHYTMYIASSHQLEQTHAKISPGDSLSNYGRSIADMITEADGLGLSPVKNKKQQTIGYEGELWPGHHSARAAEIIGDLGGYSLMSGASHAEFWSVLSAMRHGGPNALGLTADEQDSDVRGFITVTHACINALTLPALEAYKLFDRKLLRNDLIRIHDMADPLIDNL